MTDLVHWMTQCLRRILINLLLQCAHPAIDDVSQATSPFLNQLSDALKHFAIQRLGQIVCPLLGRLNFVEV